MDLSKFTNNADLKSAHDDFQKKANDKLDAVKREEIFKVRKAFEDYFLKQGNFTVKNLGDKVVAEYNRSSITLNTNEAKNMSGMSMINDFSIEGLRDKPVVFFTPVHASKEYGNGVRTDIERMQHNLEYYKDVVNGDLVYSYKYAIQGEKNKVYDTIEELFSAL